MLSKITIDEKIHNEESGKDSAFGNFFSYHIENLSDGEEAYLGLYASLYEQISIFANDKEKYIISTHSPFILSDIQGGV